MHVSNPSVVSWDQDVAYDPASEDEASAQPNSQIVVEGGKSLVADCELEDMKFSESPLDKILLSIFRDQVTKNTGGVTSDVPGIKGLLAQGREYMTKELPEGVTYAEHSKEQNTMVKKTLGGLMTPVLPPFYRIFMAGIVPKLGTEWGGKQIGPWFYAPWLTTIVTPIFFGFLVGPSRPNRRSDGQRGGLVVEKCKFLQESGCKGLCLHQCKIPAQEFFSEELGESFLSCGHTIDLLAPTNLHPPVNTMKLGLDLTVKPNFITQVSEHRKEVVRAFGRVSRSSISRLSYCRNANGALVRNLSPQTRTRHFLMDAWWVVSPGRPWLTERVKCFACN